MIPINILTHQVIHGEIRERAMSPIKEKSIKNTLPVAREGIIFIGIGIGLTFFFWLTGFLYLAFLMGILSLFIVYFFRDPVRGTAAMDGKTVLTPADGRIIGIQDHQDYDNPLGQPGIKISIFMSIFNVHVNRIPMNGRIFRIVYSRGQFFSANLDKASDQNERNTITLETDQGQKIVFIQIAGLIARRIACWVKEGDRVLAGQRFGLIRFGSRLDVYLPLGSRVVIHPHDRVKAGESILGYLS